MRLSTGRLIELRDRAIASAEEHLPDTLLGLARRLYAVRLVGVAAEVAFFAVLAAIPMALAILSTLDVLLGAQEVERVVAAIRAAVSVTLTGEAEVGMLRSVDRIVASPGPRLLPLSLLSLAVFASRGFVGTLRGLAVVYGTLGQRTWLDERLWALAFTVLGVLLVAFGTAAFVLGPLLGAGLGLADRGGIGTFASGVWLVGRWVAMPVAVTVFLTVLYHVARGRRGRWTRDLPGAVGAMLGLTVVALGYRFVLLASPRLGSLPSGQGDDIVGALLVGLLSSLFLLAIASGIVLIGGAWNAEADPDVPEVDPSPRGWGMLTSGDRG